MIQGLVGDSRVRLHQRDEDRPKLGVSPCELNGESGEYELEVATVLEVP